MVNYLEISMKYRLKNKKFGKIYYILMNISFQILYQNTDIRYIKIYLDILNFAYN